VIKTENALRIYKTAVIGGAGYCILEILWRGRTHISMAFAGALSLLFIVYLCDRHTSLPLPLKATLSSVFISAIEFLIGIIVNLWLKFNVWDYSDNFGNIMGQVCPLYSILWFFLSYVIIFVIEYFGI